MKTTLLEKIHTKREAKAMQERISKAQEKSKKQIESASEKIKEQAERENATNRTARETMKAYLQFGESSEQFGKALLSFSSCIAQNRLKVLLQDEKTWNELLYSFKADIARKKAIESFLDNVKALNGDGADLQSIVALSVIEYLHKCKRENLTESTLTDIFETFDVKSMYYKTGELKDNRLWTKSATNLVKEAGKEVSKAIKTSASVKDAGKLYNAIEIKLEYTDADGIEKEETRTVYKQASAFSAYEITDINGKQFASVSNEEREEQFKNALAKLNLSTMQRRILNYCYLGMKHRVYEEKDGERVEKRYTDFTGKECIVYSEKPISLQEFADVFNIDIETVKTHNARLLKKVKESGIVETAKQADESESRRNYAEQAIAVYTVKADNTLAYYTTFASVKQASENMNTSKACVSQIINGKRKSFTKDGVKYTFKRA